MSIDVLSRDALALVDYFQVVIKEMISKGYLAHSADCEVNDGHANCTCGYLEYMARREKFLKNLKETP